MNKKSKLELYSTTLQNGTTSSPQETVGQNCAIMFHIRCDVEVTLQVYFNNFTINKATDRNLSYEEVIPADTYFFRSYPVNGLNFSFDIVNANPTGTDNIEVDIYKSSIPFFKVA